MAKFHYSTKTKKIEPCKAKWKKCPYIHFDSLEEGEVFLAENYSLLGRKILPRSIDKKECLPSNLIKYYKDFTYKELAKEILINKENGMDVERTNTFKTDWDNLSSEQQQSINAYSDEENSETMNEILRGDISETEARNNYKPYVEHILNLLYTINDLPKTEPKLLFKSVGLSKEEYNFLLSEIEDFPLGEEIHFNDFVSTSINYYIAKDFGIGINKEDCTGFIYVIYGRGTYIDSGVEEVLLEKGQDFYYIGYDVIEGNEVEAKIVDKMSDEDRVDNYIDNPQKKILIKLVQKEQVMNDKMNGVV